MKRMSKAVAGVAAWSAVFGTVGVAGLGSEAAGRDRLMPSVTSGRTDHPVTQLRSFSTAEHGIRRPHGLAWDAAAGRLVIPGVARPAGTKIVALTPDESRRTTGVRSRGWTGDHPPMSVHGVAGHRLRGVAAAPGSALVYSYDATAAEVLAIDRRGRIRMTYDASELGLDDVRGLALAPSADATDHPSTTSLYIADAGAGAVTGRIVETTLDAAAVPSIAATGTLVRTTATSAYSPPSPDPSGIAYVPGPDRLFIADGEVNEMSIFQGKNLYRVTRTGTLDDTGVSLPWSEEPVGVGYNPGNNHLLVSDDDDKEVFDVAPGGDGRYGTADDTVTHFDTAGFGNTDPEGLDFDSATNSIWLVDGVNREVYRVRPGPDGQFGNGDDVRTQFDVGVYGARDPEGLGYDSVRDTIVIVDDGSDTIYELDKSGALLNTISTNAASMVAAAGLAVAPGSANPSTRTYYVVARGEDNDSHPNENDGRMYELSASLPPVGDTNQPPQVGAGADQTVILPASATLDGTVTDDGRPTGSTLTTAWTEVSGPGTVTFGNASAADTTATFSTNGTYVLRLTASDGQATTADDVTVLVLPAGSPNAVEVRVASGTDDAEQAVSGSTALTSSDLELVTDGNTQQIVGTRFTGLQIPAGATITNAYVQFRTDEVSTDAANITIRAEAHNSAPTYQATSNNLSSRAVTTASVAWTPPAWSTVGQVTAAQRTPNLAAIVQAVVDRPGWSQGNALALQFRGTGRRTAEAYEGGAASAPLLHVDYSTGPVSNRPPAVDAGSDRSVALPDVLALDGTVNDDGLPAGSSVTTTWSRVSGPGSVTFGNPAAVDTTATFTVNGSYVLRLTATDGALTAFDEVTVTVQPAGTTQTLVVPVRAGSDDAEERYNAQVLPTSSDLDITADGSRFMTAVGLRFTGVTVPGGATITSAYVQFTVDETGTDAANLTVRAQAADNAATFQATNANLSSRPTTAASVAWAPPPWTTVGAAGAGQRTSNLAPVLQQVVNRAGWVQGNAAVILITGTGDRTAQAFENANDPVLHLVWQP